MVHSLNGGLRLGLGVIYLCFVCVVFCSVESLPLIKHCFNSNID